MALPRRYPHFVEFRDLDIPLEPIVGEALDGSQRVLGWVHAGMPRILPKMEICVVFMCDASGQRGGTAFFVSRLWTSRKGERHYYLVTNSHVCKDYPVATVYMPQETPIVITDSTSRWTHYPGDAYDIAVADVSTVMTDIGGYVSAVEEESFATQAAIRLFDIGIGDEICMVGLFADEDGEHPDPVGRFGSIGALAREDLLIAGDEGEPQPSHLVDMRSRGGFSGSPVFAYRTPVTNLKSIRPNGNFDIIVKDNIFLCLLGVHRGQFPEVTKIRRGLDPQSLPLAGARIEIDSAMTTVVPAWAITSLLNEHGFEEMRKKREAAYQPPKGRVVKTEKKPQKQRDEPNPDHREDFKRLLGAAVKPPKPSG